MFTTALRVVRNSRANRPACQQLFILVLRPRGRLATRFDSNGRPWVAKLMCCRFNRLSPESRSVHPRRFQSVARIIPRQQTKLGRAANAVQDKQAISVSLFAFRFVEIVLEVWKGPAYKGGWLNQKLKTTSVVVGF